MSETSSREAPMMAHGQRRGYSMGEIAAQYGLSESFIRLEVARGRLKPVRLGRHVIITERAVEYWFRGATTTEP